MAILTRVSPFTYRGYCYDYDTALYYLQSRYYDPAIGRFINADNVVYLGTTGSVLSYNLFAYCENNPIVNTDAAGTFSMTVYAGYTNWKEPNDDAYSYHTQNPTLRDYWNWKKWGALQKAASSIYPDGAAFYNYYRSNKGGYYYYDYQKAYNDDFGIRKTVNETVRRLKSIASLFRQKNNVWYYISTSLVSVKSSTMNWKLALGGHQFGIRAHVYYNSTTHKYRMCYYILAYDRYNFDGNNKSFYGISDSLNARFVTVGFAKFFTSVGYMEGEVTWKE